MLTIAIWTHTKSETIYHHDELIKENFWALLGAIYYHWQPGGSGGGFCDDGVCLNFILLGGAFSTEKSLLTLAHHKFIKICSHM